MQQRDFTTNHQQTKPIEELFFKFIIIGDPGVGKSSLLARYVDNKFSNNYHPTIGAEFGSKTVELNETTRLRLQIWDTAGQESFSSITKSFYRNAHCIFLVYDINNFDTFEHLENWIDSTIQSADPEAILVLIGNKVDLAFHRKVPYQAGVDFMKEHNLHFFFETSAFEGKNVELAFLEAAKYAYINYTNIREEMNHGGEFRETGRQVTRDTVSLRPTRVSRKGGDKENKHQEENQGRGGCAC